MKKIFAAPGMLVLGLLCLTACSQVQAMPQDLATATQNIVNEVKEQNNSIFEEIQQNIDMVDRLKSEIENRRDTGQQKFLNKVIDELEKVTAGYENLSGRREVIRAGLLSRVAAIEELQTGVLAETARLNQQHSKYTAALRALNDQDAEILRTKKAALTQAVKYVDMQMQLWNEFHKTEQQIRSETLVVQQRIDGFLSLIESSAILFREGLNLLKLQRDINDALALFTQDLPRMEQLSRDMEQSWTHLDMLVNTLSSMSININRE